MRHHDRHRFSRGSLAALISFSADSNVLGVLALLRAKPSRFPVPVGKHKLTAASRASADFHCNVLAPAKHDRNASCIEDVAASHSAIQMERRYLNIHRARQVQTLKKLSYPELRWSGFRRLEEELRKELSALHDCTEPDLRGSVRRGVYLRRAVFLKDREGILRRSNPEKVYRGLRMRPRHESVAPSSARPSLKL